MYHATAAHFLNC